MGYPTFGPDAVEAFRILLYLMAYIFGGAALIGLALYIALIVSETLFSGPSAKSKRVKVAQSASNAHVAEVNLPTAETLIWAEPETVCLPALPMNTEMPPLAPVTQEGDSTEL